MALDIYEIGSESFARYASVPIRFLVESIYEVEPLDRNLGVQNVPRPSGVHDISSSRDWGSGIRFGDFQMCRNVDNAQPDHICPIERRWDVKRCPTSPGSVWEGGNREIPL
jgi:hypothetical protein